ncbi:nucleotide disphospho-sugar-binding domain-containing protein [Streptomyces axinellae]|uniref:nucleotide disphospho-sugar-binding domain-containing protein n=1 Tax=Streptomyces axinellae TaxID=552788 RepID=UPI0031D626F4
MRVLFVPLAAAGHFYAMVPLAWALRTAGHEVRVAVPPQLRGMVESSGLPAVSAGGSYDTLGGIRESSEAVRRLTGRSLADFGGLDALPGAVRAELRDLRRAALVADAAHQADDLVAFARAWRPQLVVGDPVAFAAALAAATVGAPLVRHLSGPLPAAARSLGNGLPPAEWPDGLHRLYAAFGVEERADPAAATVDPTPPSLQTQPVPGRIAMRYVPYNGPGPVPPWLLEPAALPRVCVSWSMSHTATSGESDYPAAATAGALHALGGVEVVATVKATDRRRFGPVPEGVRVVAELPLQLLLPTCAVAVNHGGGGTSLTVAAYGVPQVMMPHDPVHVVNAERIAAVGAGVAHRSRPVDVAGIAGCVKSLLAEDRWRLAADALRAENAAQPEPAEAVRELEAVAASGRPR